MKVNMKRLMILLADLIRRGQVTVEFKDLDMDRLEKLARSGTEDLLKQVAWVVFDDEAELTDSEKIRELKAMLAEEF